MKPSHKKSLQGLLVDVSGQRSERLVSLLEHLGIELATCSGADADLYQLVRHLQPDIILVDVNSPARDTLEHVVFAHDDMPKSVVAQDSDLRTSLGRLAGDIGMSLYVVDSLSANLLQALIDVTISQCYSIDMLQQEIAKRGQLEDYSHQGMAVH